MVYKTDQGIGLSKKDTNNLQVCAMCEITDNIIINCFWSSFVTKKGKARKTRPTEGVHSDQKKSTVQDKSRPNGSKIWIVLKDSVL